MQHQLPGHLGLRRAAASDQEALLDQAADNAEGVMDGAVRLLQHELVGAADDDRAGLAGVGHPGDLHTLARTGLQGDGEEDDNYSHTVQLSEGKN